MQGPHPSEATAPWRRRLDRFAERLGSQAHLLAARDGVVASLPLVLIGSLFLLVAQPPSLALQAWMEPHLDALLVPYRMLGGSISLYVCFATARSLAHRRGIDETGASLIAVASFLVALGTAPLAEGGWGVSARGLGSGGLFGALAIAMASVEIQAWIGRRRWTIRLPESAPDAIAKSFASIVPGFVSITLCWLLVHALGFDVVGSLASWARPLVGATDSLPGTWAVSLVDSLLWFLGVHPMAVLAPMKPLWLAMLTENMEAAAQGAILPHVATREFFLWFVWQGGSGGTLAAALLLLVTRSPQLRSVGRIGIVPALFNINEPLLFGLPLVMNPRTVVPFVVAPLATATTTWVAMSAGWVARPRLDVLWTLPAPLGAFLSTGGDPGAVVLQLINLGLAGLIWWPFLKAWDRSLVADTDEPLPSIPQPALE